MAEQTVIVPYEPAPGYTSATPTAFPVFLRFIRAGVVMGLEWTTLDFIEHAPLIVKVATFLAALALLAVLESRDWLTFKGPRHFPVAVAAVLALYLGIVAYGYWGPAAKPAVPKAAPATIEAARAKIDPPSLIQNHGMAPHHFAYIQFESTDVLKPWADRYKLVAISQIDFTNVDRRTNRAIGKSIPYSIDGRPLTLTAQVRQDQIDLVPDGQNAQVEIQVYLIPKSVDVAKITSLQSAEDLGGIYVTGRGTGSNLHDDWVDPSASTIPNPAPRHLSEAEKETLLGSIPPMRTVSISSIDTDEARNLARETAKFLRASGYKKVEDPVVAASALRRGKAINYHFDNVSLPIEIMIGTNDGRVPQK